MYIMNEDDSLETLSSKYNKTLQEYKTSYTNYVSAIENKEDNATINQYKSLLNNYNTDLRKINKQLLNNLNSSVSIYEEDRLKTLTQRQVLKSNAKDLEDEQVKIKQILYKGRVLDKTRINAELETKAIYVRYIMMCIVVIFLGMSITFML